MKRKNEKKKRVAGKKEKSRYPEMLRCSTEAIIMRGNVVQFQFNPDETEVAESRVLFGVCYRKKKTEEKRDLGRLGEKEEKRREERERDMEERVCLFDLPSFFLQTDKIIER